MGIDIPSRTGIELKVSIPLDASKPGALFAALELTPDMVDFYECLDCGFQDRYHSMWQRIKRRWHTRR